MRLPITSNIIRLYTVHYVDFLCTFGFWGIKKPHVGGGTYRGEDLKKPFRDTDVVQRAVKKKYNHFISINYSCLFLCEAKISPWPSTIPKASSTAAKRLGTMPGPPYMTRTAAADTAALPMPGVLCCGRPMSCLLRFALTASLQALGCGGLQYDLSQQSAWSPMSHVEGAFYDCHC